MICDTCRHGADLLSQKGERVLNAADYLHDECKGCDCQHDTEGQLSGKVIQR